VDVYSTVRKDVGQEENDGTNSNGKIYAVFANLLVTLFIPFRHVTDGK